MKTGNHPKYRDLKSHWGAPELSPSSACHRQLESPTPRDSKSHPIPPAHGHLAQGHRKRKTGAHAPKTVAIQLYSQKQVIDSWIARRLCLGALPQRMTLGSAEASAEGKVDEDRGMVMLKVKNCKHC